MEHQAKAPPEILKVAKFLRSNKDIKTRVGILNGKRVDYFKGKAAVKAIMSPSYAKLKGVPPQPKTDEEANQFLLTIIPFAFFLHVERGAPSGSSSSSPKHVQIVQQQTFQPELYFAWFYDGPQWTTYLGGVLMVSVILGGVMFPLWPPFMRLGAYYLSLAFFGLIGLFFATAIVRLIFYVITVVVASPGIWIFPKLFADVGFVDSFIPLWAWDLPEKKKKRKLKGSKGETLIASDGNTNGVLKRSGISNSSSDASLINPRTPGGRPKIEEVADDGSD